MTSARNMLFLTVITFAFLANHSPADELKIGSSYRLKSLKVIQIVNGSEMIVQNEDDWIWLDGVDTDGMVDGKSYTFKDLVVKVSGTKSYRTVLGAKKTIWYMETETAEERAERRKAEAREKDWQEKQFEKRKAERRKKLAEDRDKEAEKKAEQAAGAVGRKLTRAQNLINEATTAKDAKDAATARALAIRYLKEIVKEAPKSDEAKTAGALLKKLEK